MPGELQHSAKFYTYLARYNRGGCTIAQLRRLTDLGVLYDWEFTEITGEEY